MNEILGNIDSTTVWYTGLKVDGSTVIDADLKVGYVLSAYPPGTIGDGTLNATRTQAENRMFAHYLVIAVDPAINEIPSSAAPTKRRGGKVKVARLVEKISASTPMFVTGATDTAIGSLLSPANDQFYLEVDATFGSDICAVAGAVYADAAGANMTSGSFKSLV